MHLHLDNEAWSSRMERQAWDFMQHMGAAQLLLSMQPLLVLLHAWHAAVPEVWMVHLQIAPPAHLCRYRNPSSRAQPPHPLHPLLGQHVSPHVPADARPLCARSSSHHAAVVDLKMPHMAPTAACCSDTPRLVKLDVPSSNLNQECAVPCLAAGLPQDNKIFYCNAQYGSCYRYHNVAGTFNAGKTACANVGGAMASWNSLAEQNSVELYFNRESVAGRSRGRQPGPSQGCIVCTP